MVIVIFKSDGYSHMVDSAMRSYIFSSLERKILREWLEEGKKHKWIYKVWSRIRLAEKLRDDIKLYLEAYEKLKQSSSTP
ncbi:MAG: hypothetical protein ACUVTD_04745 [Nitrososphaerales archaeon]